MKQTLLTISSWFEGCEDLGAIEDDLEAIVGSEKKLEEHSMKEEALRRR